MLAAPETRECTVHYSVPETQKWCLGSLQKQDLEILKCTYHETSGKLLFLLSKQWFWSSAIKYISFLPEKKRQIKWRKENLALPYFSHSKCTETTRDQSPVSFIGAIFPSRVSSVNPLHELHIVPCLVWILVYKLLGAVAVRLRWTGPVLPRSPVQPPTVLCQSGSIPPRRRS